MDNGKNKEILLASIAELKSQIRDLEKNLIHDPLTGLKTRAFFEEESKIYLDMIANVNVGKRRQWFGFKNLSFLFIDIDHFKKVNDTHGHNMGDIVLRKVAETIQRSVRIGDTVARWGGEEIVVSLLGANLNDAESKAEDMRKEVAELNFDEIPDLKITVSIGVVSSEISPDLEDLIKSADKALYQSKQTGRNKVTVYSKDLK